MVPTVERGLRAGRLLLDADGRRQAGQVIDVGLLQLAEELAGVAGQRFDVAALALGVERVEGQRTFAGAADAGEDDQSWLRGSSRLTLRRLCSRAPRMTMVLLSMPCSD